MQGKRIWSLLAVLAWAALAAAGCSAGDGDNVGPGDGGDTGSDGEAVGPPPPDQDGDTISDADEGRSAEIDTDGDGTPDYRDLDSDADTIPDATEAGDDDARTSPFDSDGDGTPNFRDIDSDNNGIFDAAEGLGDVDGDRIPDFADLDDDGDGIPDVVEINGNPSLPPDFDHDSTPDFKDPDSDDDTIGDKEEATTDTDGDTMPDRFDEDSDGDGWLDSEEAGDADWRTPPADTDRDGIFDFRDPDSDADGLADDLERGQGTSRTDPDTDHDGTDDMIEVAAGTNPLDPGDNPPARGDFVFIVPYNNPADPPDPPRLPSPERSTLVFSTNIQVADVYFLVDCTGSMGGEIANLRSSIRGTLIPGIHAAIPDVQFGVGHIDDVPISPYGGSGDWGYENLQNITADIAAAQAAADRLPGHYGADWAESQIVGLYTVASGDGSRTLPALGPPSCAPGYVGYPCFRPGAIPIIVLITDAPMHNGPPGTVGEPYTGFPAAPTYDQAIAALNAIHARVIGVNSGTDYRPEAPRNDLIAVATATGAVDLSGTPLVYDIPSNGTGLGDQIIEAVETLATAVPLRIDAVALDVVDGPGDTVDAPAAFIQYIEANASGATVHDPVTDSDRICTVTDPPPVDDPADGHPDYFPRVLPGTSVCFDIVPRINTTVPATREPQRFTAKIQVMGDMVTVLDERDVYFVVPPEVGIILE